MIYMFLIPVHGRERQVLSYTANSRAGRPRNHPQSLTLTTTLLAWSPSGVILGLLLEHCSCRSESVGGLGGGGESVVKREGTEHRCLLSPEGQTTRKGQPVRGTERAPLGQEVVFPVVAFISKQAVGERAFQAESSSKPWSGF